MRCKFYTSMVLHEQSLDDDGDPTMSIAPDILCCPPASTTVSWYPKGDDAAGEVESSCATGILVANRVVADSLLPLSSFLLH